MMQSCKQRDDCDGCGEQSKRSIAEEAAGPGVDLKRAGQDKAADDKEADNGAGAV